MSRTQLQLGDKLLSFSGALVVGTVHTVLLLAEGVLSA